MKSVACRVCDGGDYISHPESLGLLMVIRLDLVVIEVNQFLRLVGYVLSLHMVLALWCLLVIPVLALRHWLKFSCIKSWLLVCLSYKSLWN